MSESVTRYGRTWTEGSPYRGAKPFDYAHHQIFFGRGEPVEALEKVLIANAASGKAFVLVTGVSGIGKSSLVNAGLLPRLAANSQKSGIGLFRRAVVRFTEKEPDVFQSLTEALVSPDALPELVLDGTPINSVRQMIRENPAACGMMLKSALAMAAREIQFKQNLPELPKPRMLLVVDQLEELYQVTQRDHQLRRDIFQVITSLAKSGLVWVVGTLRSDFIQHCFQDPDFAALREGVEDYELKPPTAPEIGQIIRSPAIAAGWEYEESAQSGIRLDNLIREAIGEDRSALPLLERFLDQLYRVCEQADKEQHCLITYEGYAKTQGFEAFVVMQAEMAVETVSDEAQQALDDVLRALVAMSLGENEQVVRRFATYDEAADNPQKREIVDSLVACGVLVAGARPADKEPGIILAHACLLSEWRYLKEFIEEDKDAMRARTHLMLAGSRWQMAGQSTHYLLLSDQALDDARAIAESAGNKVSEAEKAFLEASAKASRERNLTERKRKQFLQRLGIAATAIIIGVLSVSLYQINEERKEVQAALEAKEQAERLAAEERAKRQKAEGFVKQMLADMQDGGMNEERLAALTDTALNSLDLLESAQEDSPEGRRAKGLSLKRFADTFLEKAQPAEAAKFYQQALDMLLPLAQSEGAPIQAILESLEARGGLARAQMLNGRVAEGRGELKAYLRDLNALAGNGVIADSVIAERATSAYDFIIDAYVDTGNGKEAQATAQEALEALAVYAPPLTLSTYGRDIASRLRERYFFPQSLAVLEQTIVLARQHSDAQADNRELALRYLQLLGEPARTHLAAKQPEQALAQLDRQRGVVEEYASRFLDDSALRGLLGAVLNELGALNSNLLKPAQARLNFAKAVSINEQLVELEPWEIRWREQLGLGLQYLGDAELTLGNYEQAQQHLEAAREILRVLLHKNPEDASLRAGLTTTYLKLGISLFALGDNAQSIRQLEQGLNLREGLTIEERSNVDASQPNVEVYRTLGLAHENIGSWQKALDYFSQERQLRELNDVDAGRDPLSARALADLYDAMGRVYIRLGKQEEAIPYLRQRLRLLEGLDEVKDEGIMADLYGRLANALLATGKAEEAAALQDKQTAMLEAKLKQNPQNEELTKELAKNISATADNFLEAGAIAEAARRYARAIELIEPLAYTSRLDDDERIDLADLHRNYASQLMNLGQLEVAEGSFQRALELYENIVDADSPNELWRRELAKLYQRMGEVLLLRGNSSAGRAFFEKGKAFAEKLKQEDPGQDYYQYLVANYVHYLGHVAAREANPDGALEQQEQALATVQTILQRQPANTEYRTLLTSIYDQLGDLYNGMGKEKEGLLHLQKRLPVAKELAEEEPRNPARKRDLALNYLKLGESLTRMNRKEQARDMYQRSIYISEALNESGQSLDAGSLGNMALAYKSLGDLVETSADAPAARDAYLKARELGERVSQMEQENPGWLILLANVNSRLGDIYLNINNADEAIVAYGKARDNLQEIVERAPYLSGWRRDLMQINGRLGELHFQSKLWPQAREYFNSQLLLIRSLMQRGDNDRTMRHDRFISCQRIAETYMRENNHGEAMPYAKEAMEYLRDLVTATPGDEQLQFQLAGMHNQMGVIHLQLDEQEDARSQFILGASTLEMLCELEPANTALQIDLAKTQLNVIGSYTRAAVADPATITTYFAKAAAILEPLQVNTRLTPSERDMVKALQDEHKRLYKILGM